MGEKSPALILQATLDYRSRRTTLRHQEKTEVYLEPFHWRRLWETTEQKIYVKKTNKEWYTLGWEHGGDGIGIGC